MAMIFPTNLFLIKNSYRIQGYSESEFQKWTFSFSLYIYNNYIFIISFNHSLHENQFFETLNHLPSDPQFIFSAHFQDFRENKFIKKFPALNFLLVVVERDYKFSVLDSRNLKHNCFGNLGAAGVSTGESIQEDNFHNKIVLARKNLKKNFEDFWPP